MEGPFFLRSVLVVLVAVAGVYFIDRRRQQQKHALLPPGPPGSPHARYPPRLIQSWIEQYGPVISLRQGNDVLVIIGRHSEATQLLEKQGACFVDRPHSVAGSEILGRGMRFMLLSTCDRLRRFRKAAHTHFQPKATLAYDADQTSFARNIVIDLLDDPESHQSHVKRFSGSVTLRVIYGKTTPVSLTEDPCILHLKRMVPVVQGALLPGAYKVDHFPILRYIPWYGRQLKKWGEEEFKALTSWLSQYKSQMMTDSGPQSVAKEIVTRTVTEGNFTEQETAYFLGSLVGAAFDTTQVAISTIMMAAARFPEAQAVVHAQLDAVVGREAPPTFAEWVSLTELQAFILEALRWRPVNPFGAPRRASKDVFWNGYCIPAGATVFGNHWSIARDPDVFPNPEKFIPKRWIGPDGNINNDLKAYSFGFGRRTCVGSNLAIRSLYIASATIFWAFRVREDVKRPIDDTAFVPGIVSHQKPFSLLFEPRMDAAHLREVMGTLGKAA
ncbi:cytochrome P450 [Boletus reticuloceps]|uniref:Cytochrome P450 n=1 Tax=Boletus reticuloceps TaxID=495285 RepID=A0A8I2YKL7_9AGAM|nr:cytochrome P450 [Boletus reticuloceps]